MKVTKMRILVLSFYYPPDLSAGSFRVKALIEALYKRLKPGDEIEVITTIPNRYKSYDAQSVQEEVHGSIRIIRINIPRHKGGMLSQSLAFINFAKNVKKIIKNKKYDLIFATSSRLATAYLAARISRKLKIPLYLDIRDIFTDTIENIFSARYLFWIFPVFRNIERYTINSASKVNLVSEGFKEHFLRFAPDQNYSYYSNGVDESFLECDYRKNNGSDKKIILYAGNIGAGQGLHHLIPQAALLIGHEYEIHVVGDGGMRQLLEDTVRDSGVENVRFFDPVARDLLIEHYKNADYLFLHLNDYEAFKKVLPSKIFEYAATGKPILAGVAGYAQEFIQQNVINAICFKPCDSHGFVNALRTIDIKVVERDAFIKKYNRSKIMSEMSDDIISMITS